MIELCGSSRSCGACRRRISATGAAQQFFQAYTPSYFSVEEFRPINFVAILRCDVENSEQHSVPRPAYQVL